MPLSFEIHIRCSIPFQCGYTEPINCAYDMAIYLSTTSINKFVTYITDHWISSVWFKRSNVEVILQEFFFSIFIIEYSTFISILHFQLEYGIIYEGGQPQFMRKSSSNFFSPQVSPADFGTRILYFKNLICWNVGCETKDLFYWHFETSLNSSYSHIVRPLISLLEF